MLGDRFCVGNSAQASAFEIRTEKEGSFKINCCYSSEKRVVFPRKKMEAEIKQSIERILI